VHELAELDAVHVVDLGWQGRKNGVLLASMRAEGFTIFITVDRNLPYQQNIASAGVAVIVLEAATNRLSELRPLMREVRAILSALVPGQVYRTGV
jgi:hypothetical protein